MKIENLKAAIKEIDDILDDDSISNEMYTQLDEVARILTKVLGELENEQNFKNVKEFKKISDWKSGGLYCDGIVSKESD